MLAMTICLYYHMHYHINQFIDGDAWYTKCIVLQNTTKCTLISEVCKG